MEFEINLGAFENIISKELREKIERNVLERINNKSGDYTTQELMQIALEETVKVLGGN